MGVALVKVTEAQKIEHYMALSFQSNSLPHVIWTGKQRIEVTAIPTKYKYSTPTLINQNPKISTENLPAATHLLTYRTNNY